MKALGRLWRDERGFVVSTELVLVSTILVLGMIVGMKKISSQVLLEMSDVANAVGFLNQGYSYAGATFTAGDGSMLASWSGTGLLQDSVDIGAGDYTSIAVNVTAGSDLSLSGLTAKLAGSTQAEITGGATCSISAGLVRIN